ncbi:hypothetical protein CEXT_724431 [Caerostris extrusa]|uniref:Uncharacterized protein n=1 Tax=Caerostris extrusa TaxID=172846 RepID=A0AAV4N3S0_CAEEX|nr:hypothetical protein CEXT_724431 [Caerostris extrusa]
MKWIRKGMEVTLHRDTRFSTPVMCHPVRVSLQRRRRDTIWARHLFFLLRNWTGNVTMVGDKERCSVGALLLNEMIAGLGSSSTTQ